MLQKKDVKPYFCGLIYTIFYLLATIIYSSCLIEVVELCFDSALSSYDALLRWFFGHHNPSVHQKKQVKC